MLPEGRRGYICLSVCPCCGGGGEGAVPGAIGHRGALLLSSKRISKGKIKSPFDSDMAHCLRQCQEAQDQIQLDTIQYRTQQSLEAVAELQLG